MRYRPIRRNSEFGRVYARGKSYVNPALVLYVLKTRGKKTRVGLTATKKIGHAVQRNRARRVKKAAIDEHLDQNIGGFDFLFVSWGMTCPTRQSSLAQSPLPRARPQTVPHNSESRLPRLPERALCAHPVLPALYQPGAGPQLPLYPHLQPVWNRSHPDPWLHQGLAARSLAHRPVQSAWPVGR